jgi:3,2-trans-enoyl-CoA isomerase
MAVQGSHQKYIAFLSIFEIERKANMEYLDLVIEDRIAHVRLNRGKSNAMNGVLIAELHTLIDQLDNDEAIAGLVLHGKEGFFSAGLDLIELYNYNEAEVREFWTNFIAMVRRFVAFSKPSVAAINGHSPAGGCVLAICCDYRVMAAGEYIIGLNELQVGIVVPEAIFHLYSFWIGQANAYRNLMDGRLLNPVEAHQMGLVDELVESDRLMSTADKRIKKYTQLEFVTWRKSKLNLRRGLIERFNQDHTEDIEEILTQWWAPSTRAILKAIIENLTSKK